MASAGSAVVAVICYFIISDRGASVSWPSLFLIITATAVLMLLLRAGFAQSPQWLMERGEKTQAEKAVKKLLGPDVIMEVAPTSHHSPDTQSMGSFFKNNMAKIVLTGIPWACEGLGVYGIGIFLPVLIMSFHLDSLPASASQVEHITHSVGLTFVLCLVMMAGFLCGLMLLKRVNHLRLQSVGFVMSAVGLGVLMAAYLLHWPVWIAIGGFVVFEIFLNAGPHLITFILPSSIYPVEDRGTGSGIAAGVGKSGAVIGAFIIPLLLRWGGATLVLIVSIAVMVAGAIVTSVAGRIVSHVP